MDLKLPHLGEGADSGTVVSLFVKEGDQVAKDQPVLELENEKAVASIPSTMEGVVRQIFVKPGDKISVGQRILALDGPSSPATEEPAKVQAPPAPAPKLAAPSVPQPAQGQSPEEPLPQVAMKPGAVPAASPSIRKLAHELGIDLWRVRGSQRGGRIALEDVRAYIQRLQGLDQPAAARATAPPAAPAAKPAAAPIDFSKWGPISRTRLSSLRQVIARRMAEAWVNVPRVTQFDEADITGLMALRKQFAPSYEQKGARLTLTSLALHILARALKKHTLLNSSLDESSQELVVKEYCHIGLAVDTEAGLIVPVVRDADKKNLLELSHAVEELAGRARERKVSAEELKGASFTLSNQGGIGGGHFTPIVNAPEVAILGLGRASYKAVFRENQFQPRLLLPMALSYDHRVVDGANAARFMVDLVQGFETFPEPELQRALK